MPRKKGEEYQPWLNPHLHVWRNKVGDLTVINLRSVDVDLGPVVEPALPTPKPAPEPERRPTAAVSVAAAAAMVHDAPAPKPTPAAAQSAGDSAIVTAVKSTAAAETAAATEVNPVTTLLRQFMAKNEQSKRQSLPGSSSTGLGAATTAALPAAHALHTPAPAAMPVSALAGFDGPARTREHAAAAPGMAQPAHAPPPGAPTAARSPDLLGAAASKPMEFEFVSGTNIPGRGVVVNNTSPPLSRTESPPPSGHGFALFHDPLWGDVDSTLFLSAAAAAASTAPPASQPNASQALLNQFTQPLYNFNVYQTPQGVLTSSTAPPMMARLPMPGAPTATAAFQAMPTGYAGAAAPQMAAAMQQFTGLAGMPMAYIQAGNAPAMLPVQYMLAGDPTHAAHHPMVLQSAMHAPPVVSQPQPQPPRAGVSASLSPTPSAGGSSSTGGAGARAGTNIEAQPFVPGGTKS